MSKKKREKKYYGQVINKYSNIIHLMGSLFKIRFGYTMMNTCSIINKCIVYRYFGPTSTAH